MLTLIRREIRDNLIYILAPGVLSLLTIGILVSVFLSGIKGAAVSFAALMLLVQFLAFGALGSAQMYGDRANRISSLLSTLAVTRDRILAARVLTGVLAILAALVPILVASVILLRLFLPPFEFYRRMVVEVSVATMLTGVACYCVGLLVGGTTNRVWLLVGNLLLLALCASLLLVKGFGPEVMLLLAVLIGALLVRTWYRFTTASL
jgi:ABC-type transport system involved in multi-copper enzyme maturation permease subunit